MSNLPVALSRVEAMLNSITDDSPNTRPYPEAPFILPHFAETVETLTDDEKTIDVLLHPERFVFDENFNRLIDRLIAELRSMGSRDFTPWWCANLDIQKKRPRQIAVYQKWLPKQSKQVFVRIERKSEPNLLRRSLQFQLTDYGTRTTWGIEYASSRNSMLAPHLGHAAFVEHSLVEPVTEAMIAGAFQFAGENRRIDPRKLSDRLASILAARTEPADPDFFTKLRPLFKYDSGNGAGAFNEAMRAHSIQDVVLYPEIEVVSDSRTRFARARLGTSPIEHTVEVGVAKKYHEEHIARTHRFRHSALHPASPQLSQTARSLWKNRIQPK